MLLASRCPVCRVAGPAPCARCEAALVPPPSLPLPPGLDGAWSVCAFDDAGRALVHAVKFGNDRATAKWAAVRIAAGLGTVRPPLPPTGWALTWAPTSAERRRARGFDQAERLARLVGRRTGVRPRALLVRAPGLPQTGRSAHDRWAGPSFVRTRRPVPAGVVIVDDVVTTGATASAAARALRAGAGGARRVWIVSIARTSFKLRSERADGARNASDLRPGRQDAGDVVSLGSAPFAD